MLLILNAIKEVGSFVPAGNYGAGRCKVENGGGGGGYIHGGAPDFDLGSYRHNYRFTRARRLGTFKSAPKPKANSARKLYSACNLAQHRRRSRAILFRLVPQNPKQWRVKINGGAGRFP